MSERRGLGPEQVQARKRANKVTNWLILLFGFLILVAILRFSVWPIVGPYILR